MKIKGHIIRENKALLSGRLYEVTCSRTIVFAEKSTNDIVPIHFCIKDHQYGIYGNEFKPDFVEDQGGKKADILALVIDETEKRFGSWVIDVKQTVGGEDVIYHLVEQLTASVQHKKSITTYLEGYEEKQHIGYVTGNLERDRIAQTISKKTARLTDEKQKLKRMPLLIAEKKRIKLLKEEAGLKVIQEFQDNCIRMGEEVLHIETYLSLEQDGKNVYELTVSCS